MTAVHPLVRGLFLLSSAVLPLPTTHAQEVDALPVEGLRDETGEGRAFVEVVAPRDTYFVHEVVTLTVRVGFEADFLGEHLIQLFRRELDVPVQLSVPWLDELAGATPLPPDPTATLGGEARASLVVNEGLARCARTTEVREGGRFVVLALERSYLPERAGALVIGEVRARFAYATRFVEDLLEGRVPADRHDALVTAPPRTLRIRALPEEGRPADFGGAVGRFLVRAEATPRSLRVGESLKLVLRVEGTGNLGFFEPPRLDRLAGFRLYGREEGDTPGVFTYDLAPESVAIEAVPSIAFSFFEPGESAGYRTVQSAPIPIAVRAPARASGAPDGDAGATGGPREGSPDEPSGWSKARLVGALVAVLLALVVLVRIVSGRGRGRPEPDQVRAGRAAAELRERVAAGGDRLDALVDYLAARLRCPVPAVIGPDLESRLAGSGLPSGLAARTASAVEDLVAERYGGGGPTADQAEVLALVDALEAAFRGARRARG